MNSNWRSLLFLSITIASALPSIHGQTQPGVFAAVAGNGSPVYSGDNVAATSTGLRGGQLARDAAGNVYIADYANNRIRRVSAGIITTVAGGGTGGDGGLATDAALQQPCGVAVDSASNLYITETCVSAGGGGGGGGTPLTNGRVRKVTAATGVISTLVGVMGLPGPAGNNGPASLAGVNTPGDVAVDGAGNIFIADSGNHSVRRIDAATQIITQVAGTGFAGYFGENVLATNSTLNYPAGLAVDGAGNLYIADSQNHRIRKVTAATNLINTIAGNGTPGYNGDGIPATSAAINTPIGVTVDNAGNVYFVESVTGAGRIRRVDAVTGRISTVFALFNGTPAMFWQNRPIGLLWMPDNRLIVSDVAQNLVQSVTLGSGAASSTALTVTPTTPAPGQQLLLTATVTPSTATGSVYFFNSTVNGPSPMGNAPLVNGVATLTLPGLANGDYKLVAVYTGAPAFQASTAPEQAVPVRYNTSLGLTSSLNPSTPGQAVTFTVTLSQGAGTVEFRDGAAVIGSVYAMGSGTFTTSTLTPGAHNITAYFPGDAYTFPATSPVLLQTVKNATTTTLSANPLTAIPGQAVTLTAGVTPATATGTIEFLDGATLVGSVNISAGSATLSTSTLAAGQRSLTARYVGDTTHSASNSSAVTVTVKAATTTTLVATPTTVNAGTSVSLTASVAPAAATGTVEFLDGATLVGSASVNAGTATLSLSTLGTGQRSLTARYLGDSAHNVSNSSAVTVTVKADSTTTLTATPTTVNAGSSVTLTAAVTPVTATGAVEFLDGATVIGSANLSTGAATLATSALTAGVHPLSARYVGDTSVNTSTSAAVSVTVKAAATVALTAAPNPVTVSSPVTLTATITPATATGTVQFLDGAAVVGTGTISAGVAAVTLTTLPAGAHSLTASYSGDAQTANATSAAVALPVLITPTIQLQANTTLSAPGQSLQFSAILSPSDATGTVQFFDNGVSLGTAAINSGLAQFSTSALTLGSHSITATYSGNTTYAGVTSAVVTVSVKTQPTSTLASNPPNSATAGQSVTITATLNADATGTVQFLDSGTPLGAPVTLTGGAATYTTAALTPGNHAITASFSGDERYHAGSLSGFQFSVRTAGSITLVSNANPSTVGQTFTLTATVTPSTATGSVAFVVNGASSSAPVVNGVASIQIGYHPAGTYSYTAVYSGDTSVSDATSAPLIQVVKATTTAAVASSANPSAAGQNVTFTAQVTPATATGTVQFLDNGVVIGTATLAAGNASFTTAALAAATHSITVAYAGDTTHAASTSGALAQTVNKLTTTAVVASSANPSVAGQSVTLTAQVTPATAAGTVQFLDNGIVIATATLASGSASFTTTALAVGAHPITVVYSGSATHLASTSAALGQNVNKANSATAVTSSLNPSATGQAVTFTVTVTPASATGTVQLSNGTTTLATLTLNAAGTATYTTSALAAGTRSITAVYAGNTSLNGSTSPVLSQVVRTATTLTLTSNRNPARTTQSVTFTARVTPTAATGTVQFFDGATLLGTANISSGSATLTRTGMSVATHPIQAVYSGSANHAPSTSAVLNQSITAN